MPNELFLSKQSTKINTRAPSPYLEIAVPPNRSKLKLLRQQVAKSGYRIDARAISARITEFYVL